MPAPLAPTSAGQFADELSRTVVACYGGDQASAFAALVGATILAADSMPDPEEMLDVAIAGLTSARTLIAERRAIAAAKVAAASEALS